MMEFRAFDDFIPIAKENRGKASLQYGIEYLDRATGGIRSSDLVVIGGRTGAGKTELSSIIAQNNALLMKKVYVFSLESERGEFVNRILFRRFSKHYYAAGHKKPVYYRSFIEEEYDSKYGQLIKEAESDAEFRYPSLNILERDDYFGILEFKMCVQMIKDDADLIIVDHLHHFDSDTDNEIREIKETVKAIRDMCLLHNKPIILIAHFRKGDRKSKELVPDLEEFHGSSEISKVATQVITLARYEEEQVEPCLYPTLFKVCKFRKDGSVARYVGKQYYSTIHNNYEKRYTLHTLEKSGTELADVPECNYPHWARTEVINKIGDVRL